MTAAVTDTVTVTDAVAQRRQAGWRSLSQVNAELARGDLERAAQALWEAAAHGVKAAAAQRGWPHDSFRDLAEAVSRLHDAEDGPPELHWNFVIASNYLRNGRMWPMPIDDAGVRHGAERVAELLQILEGMDCS